MGVGDPVSVVEAVALGVDMVDCVLPTRLGRHGTALTSAGRLSLRRAAMATDDGPVDPRCGCETCSRFSRAYLRHLFSVAEPAGARLLTIHNLTWILGLMADTRAAIHAGTLSRLRGEIATIWP
jgi:queuine tRNA-ribosyltransferase